MSKENYKVTVSSNKSFFRAIIIAVIVFILTAFFTLRLINYLYYEEIKEDSISIAKSYANELSQSDVALETINNLVDDRLELTAKLVTKSTQNSDINQLINIANEYNVREINIFNQEGVIHRSNIEDQIGWRIKEYHPAYEYFNDDSNQEMFIENIRQDVLSDTYMKYAYYKNNDGEIVQIGMAADAYYDLIDYFQIQTTLEELNKFNDIIGAQFIDNSLNITHQESSIDNFEFELDESKTNAINQDMEYSYKTYCCGEDVYEVMIPVYRDNNKIGTLAISFLISDLINNLRLIYIIGVAILILVFLAVAWIIFKLNKKNKRLVDLVYYDQLTGLPNLDYLVEYFNDLADDMSEQDDIINRAIILIDIVNLHIIYLTHGFEQGETILEQISNQINNLLSQNEKLFMIADSQFIIYVQEYKTKEHLLNISSKINSLFNPNRKDSNIPSHVTVKMGIKKIKNSSEDIFDIIKDAQIAANSIATNEFNCQFFNSEMAEEIARKNYIGNEIKDFIKGGNNSIYMDYQPQLDLRTNKISGFEGLARMTTEKLGQVSPLEFIGVAEESNLIIDLGLIFLKKACEFLNELNKQGFPNVIVAVNMSIIQVLRDDFYENVKKIIEETNINPNNLELEITESEFLENFEIVNKNLVKLKKMGISIAIDDFGTGYSSLDRLRELSVDKLKIDKSFIDRTNTSKSEKLITGDIISLAHKIGLKTVAEGVEYQKQKDYLIENNGDIMQGYLFSKPVSHKKAFEMLREE